MFDSGSTQLVATSGPSLAWQLKATVAIEMVLERLRNRRLQMCPGCCATVGMPIFCLISCDAVMPDAYKAEAIEVVILEVVFHQ